MHITFDIEVTDRGGVPQARVTRERAWDLVDYLSNQRVQVTYSFEADRVLVNFHHMGYDAVRELIETWHHGAEREAAHSGTSGVSHEEQWLVGTRRH